jgi:hypothetical protein
VIRQVKHPGVWCRRNCTLNPFDNRSPCAYNDGMSKAPETYSESAKGLTISKARALREVTNHGADLGDFLAEMGDHETYKASAVLNWLGY